ncbi:MAG: hypothetical protein HQK83_10040 [Fibrobacteria bacterium]|nr:hypothetical protein [Fibrobacteria bacterium]
MKKRKKTTSKKSSASVSKAGTQAKTPIIPRQYVDVGKGKHKVTLKKNKQSAPEIFSMLLSNL